MRNLEGPWNVRFLLTFLFFDPVSAINVYVNVSISEFEKWDHNPDKATFSFCPETEDITRTYLELNFELEESQ